MSDLDDLDRDRVSGEPNHGPVQLDRGNANKEQTMNTETRNNPAHYRRMSEPFPSADEANEALAAFFADVRAARDRHRIADVVVLCEVSHTLDGEEVRGAADSFMGDSARALPMLAREFGAAQQRHVDHIALTVARGRKAR
jgi:hypothetical protein